MRNPIFHFLIFIITLTACSDIEKEQLASFETFCEMVANEAKPLALSAPLPAKQMDKIWPEFERIASDYLVELYRENDFPNTSLFPKDVAKDKSVTIIYQGERLTQYQQLKEDIQSSDRQDRNELNLLSRRFGRLLGYSPQGINGLLSVNSDYTNLQLSGVEEQVTHLYYSDLEEAIKFYEVSLGLPKSDESKFQIGNDAFIKLHSNNDDHPVGQNKSTAIALLTDQLPGWYEFLQSKDIPIKYTYKPKIGGPHDGFVALDPQGYLLEFEEFKQHPENELFMAVLEHAPRINTAIDSLKFYGSITWTYHNDVLKMQNFYEQILGFQMVADQGWTKIFQTSESGFIGLVDERRGMEDYSDEKSIEIEWGIENVEALNQYASENWEEYLFTSGTFVGPEKYKYQITSN